MLSLVTLLCLPKMWIWNSAKILDTFCIVVNFSLLFSSNSIYFFIKFFNLIITVAKLSCQEFQITKFNLSFKMQYLKAS